MLVLCKCINDKIITSSHGEKEEYSFDEVKTFEIFYKVDEIGFRLTMNDDRDRKLDKECIDGVEKMIDLLASQNIQ